MELTAEEFTEAITEFKSLLNVTDEQFILVVGAILMGFNPRGPYPVFYVQGGEGSAKGSLVEAMKSVLDPNKTPHTMLPKDQNDLIIQAASNRVLSFDNLSSYTFTKTHSDLFAQMATGVSLRKRMLRTDDDECILNICRMVFLNGIDHVVTQSDLASRTIGLRLNKVEACNRISKQEFDRRLVEVQPKFFSAMMKVLSQILVCHASVEISTESRMIDTVKWVTAAEGSHPAAISPR